MYTDNQKTCMILKIFWPREPRSGSVPLVIFNIGVFCKLFSGVLPIFSMTWGYYNSLTSGSKSCLLAGHSACKWTFALQGNPRILLQKENLLPVRNWISFVNWMGGNHEKILKLLSCWVYLSVDCEWMKNKPLLISVWEHSSFFSEFQKLVTCPKILVDYPFSPAHPNLNIVSILKSIEKMDVPLF